MKMLAILALVITLAAPAVAQAPTVAEAAWTELAKKDLAVTVDVTEAQLAIAKGQRPSGARGGP